MSRRAEKGVRSAFGAGVLQGRSLNSAAMTTAVQPTELVFEFASNGMDEINQVSARRRRFGAVEAHRG